MEQRGFTHKDPRWVPHNSTGRKKMKGITGTCLEILCNEISRLLFNVSHKDYNTGMFTIYNIY